jgi:hypothetical protein
MSLASTGRLYIKFGKKKSRSVKKKKKKKPCLLYAAMCSFIATFIKNLWNMGFKQVLQEVHCAHKLGADDIKNN